MGFAWNRHPAFTARWLMTPTGKVLLDGRADFEPLALGRTDIPRVFPWQDLIKDRPTPSASARDWAIKPPARGFLVRRGLQGAP